MQKKKRSQWRKLDNAAQAFPAATGKKDTRVFRLYCELKEDVIEEVLQKAVECTLEKYPLYCSVLRKGLFWFYMEHRNLKPKVKAEDRPPCSGLYVPDQKSFLFEVSYYKKKINLEVFHCLTDGTGALNFLKELVRNYLMIAIHRWSFRLFQKKRFPQPVITKKTAFRSIIQNQIMAVSKRADLHSS